MGENIVQKKCSKCGELKQFDAFTGNKGARDGLTSQCKVCAHAYYLANKERVLACSAKWKKENSETRRASGKRYREKNAEAIAAYNKTYDEQHLAEKHEYYLRNKVEITARSKKWKSENNGAVLKSQKKYRQNNKEKLSAAVTEYRRNNREKYNAAERAKYRDDVQTRLSSVLRARLNMAIRGNHKAGSAVRDLGCSISELKQHLADRFQEGMSWANWSMHGWHIDHKKPLASFDLADREQLLEACHYTNLQPLWATENLSKGCRVEEE